MDYGLSFHFEKSLSYKIYISMACLLYVCAHIQLSIPLQKIFSHKIYIWRSSLQYQYWVCVHLCSFKFPFWENPFLQNLHWHSLFPVYVHSCPVKYPFTENIFSQNLNWNIISPVCVCSCSCYRKSILTKLILE